METENVKTKRIVIEYTDAADLRKKLKEEEKALVGTRTFDVFKPVALCSEEVISINQKYSIAEALKKRNDNMLTPLRVIYQNELIKKKNGRIITVYETTVHDALRKLTLCVFGVTQNIHLKQNQLIEAQEVYQGLKDLFLEKYDERLARLEEDSNDPISNYERPTSSNK
ncbi:TPA: hypothetical protein ACGBG5_003452 [Enterococcus faecalis]